MGGLLSNRAAPPGSAAGRFVGVSGRKNRAGRNARSRGRPRMLGRSRADRRTAFPLSPARPAIRSRPARAPLYRLPANAASRTKAASTLSLDPATGLVAIRISRWKSGRAWTAYGQGTGSIVELPYGIFSPNYQPA